MDLYTVNRALAFLGVAAIGSLADSSPAARVMAALLPDTKKVVLNEFPWSFALRIEPLVASSAAPPAGYLHAFAYPEKALNVQRVYGASGFRGLAEFRVAGKVIGANIESGTVEYTADVSDLNEWPRQILECLATRLASDAAMSLSGTPQLASAMFEKYTVLARMAAQTSVVEENVPLMRASEYVDVRR